MKIKIELDTDELNGERLHALNTLFLGVPGVTHTTLTTPEAAADQARDTNEAKTDDDDEARLYKGTTEGRSRRTKAEIAEDEKIEALFEEHKDAPGMPKKIPTDQPAADLLAELEAMEPEDDDGGGFEVEDTDTKVSEGEPLDMDEFRAILNKAIKAKGGKTVGEIMSPHKNASSVPEEERREFADQLQKAMDK